MTEIPNPFSHLESLIVFDKARWRKKLKPLKKIFSKKLAKKLFGKKFALKSRASLLAQGDIVAPSIKPPKTKKPTLQISWASDAQEMVEAQQLRYEVFAEEMGAQLAFNSSGLDIDEFDAYCDHLLVRDQESLQVVGTYRVLPPHKAREIGRLYSDSEFDLTRLNHLRPKLVEVGRSCVHADYRSGAVIMALWSGLAQYMRLHQYEVMLGCASIPMADGGHFAASLFNSLKIEQMAPIENHAFPLIPLPLERLNGGLEVEPPPLIKGYLKLGAKICSAPAWDPQFNTADVLTILRLDEISPRYAKHFFGTTS